MSMTNVKQLSNYFFFSFFFVAYKYESFLCSRFKFIHCCSSFPTSKIFRVLNNQNQLFIIFLQVYYPEYYSSNQDVEAYGGYSTFNEEYYRVYVTIQGDDDDGFNPNDDDDGQDDDDGIGAVDDDYIFDDDDLTRIDDDDLYDYADDDFGAYPLVYYETNSASFVTMSFALLVIVFATIF